MHCIVARSFQVRAFQALDAIIVHAVQPLTAPQIIVPGAGSAAELMRGFICAVLAGAAFFTGLACFFWGALLDSRQQMARVLDLLRGGR